MTGRGTGRRRLGIPQRAAAPRIVAGAGHASAGQRLHLAALALADRLGITPVCFPRGNHQGFATPPRAVPRNSPQRLDIGAVTGGIYVAVENLDSHYQRAMAAGAQIVQELTGDGSGATTQPTTFEGHLWGFGDYRPSMGG